MSDDFRLEHSHQITKIGKGQTTGQIQTQQRHFDPSTLSAAMVLPRLRPDRGRPIIVNRLNWSSFIGLFIMVTIVIRLKGVAHLGGLLMPSKDTLPLSIQPRTSKEVNFNYSHWNSTRFREYVDQLVNEEECPNFGCPIYPAELTPKTYSYLKAAVVRDKHQFYPYATDKMLILTQQGASHHENQDRGSIFDPFSISTQSQPSSNKVINGTLVCLFDGHGVQGHIVASQVLHEFPKKLLSKLEALHIHADSQGNKVEESGIIQALKDSFVEVDIQGTPNFMLGGTTGSVTLRLGSKLYIANVGDSQTIVFSLPNGTKQWNSQAPVEVDLSYVTRADKALLPEERDRIEKLGGRVHVNPHTNHSVVVVYSVAMRDTIMLAMSRSIGDWEWKAVGVIAEPLVGIVDLNKIPAHSFLMAASDGVWEKRRKQFFGKQFGECFFPNIGGNTVHPLTKGLEIFDKLTPKTQKGYRDDMTAILLRL